MINYSDQKDPEVAKLIRPHECDDCGKAYRDVRSLAEHKRTKHSGEHPVHVCYSIIMHFLDDETAKRPYCCDICGKRFTNRGTANRHKKEHLREFRTIHFSTRFIDGNIYLFQPTTILERRNLSAISAGKSSDRKEVSKSIRDVIWVRFAGKQF